MRNMEPVHARKTGSSPMGQAAAALRTDVLNSAALPIIDANYAGHGRVGGGCITTLKFFFDGSHKIRPLLTSAGPGCV